MKNFLCLLLMILSMNFSAFSQNEWYVQYAETQRLSSVNFINFSTGWAVGKTGTILKTTNSGKNWIIQQNINKDLRSVQFLDMNTGWVSGYDTTGLILKTTDGGINWVRQSSVITSNIYYIQFTDINNGWAVSNTNVIRTTNGGINWVTKSNGLNPYYSFAGYFIDQNTGFIGGELNNNKRIRKTTNGGSSWDSTFINGNVFGPIKSIDFTDINTGWAFSYFGQVLKSTNGGNSWEIIYNSNIIDGSFQFINNQYGWLAGEREINTILNTSNGGNSWTEFILSEPPLNHIGDLKSVFFHDSVSGWIGCDFGIISTVDINEVIDVGAYAILEPTTNSKYKIKCANNDTIFPLVRVQNFGNISQSDSFDVHLEIRNNNNIIYHDIKKTVVDAFNLSFVNFDPYILNFDLQTYNNEKYDVRSWTSLVTDTINWNDTTNSEFLVTNPNYGFSDLSGYYFLNSSSDASCIPDQPVFNWEDTTGSVNLIAGGVAKVPFTEGNIFNGCFRLPDVIPNGNKFRFFGVCYDTIVISTNGIIGLGSSLTGMTSSSPVQIPSVSAPRPAIFSFWYKCNYFDPEILGRNLKYKISGNKFIVTYDRLPIYNAVFDSNDYVSCQVILETGTGCGVDNGKITVQFDDSKSGSTFLNNYYNNRLNANTVGIQNSTGTIGLQYRRTENNKIVTTPGPLFGSPLAVSFGQINEVLPVELESFTSAVFENNVRLQWRVISEINNSGFEIERRHLTDIEQSGWKNIGFESGAGNSTHQNAYSFEDKNLASGKYYYRLKQIDFNGNFEYFELMNSVQIGVPKKFRLSQNYPNPFNPVTIINFDIPEDSKIVLKIYDNTGREVRTLVNEIKLAGYYKVELNGSDLASGVYFCNLQTDKFSDTKKMILLK